MSLERSESAAVTPHILVVDDDNLICQQLERLYQHGGYQVSVTHFAENALQMLEKEDIDLVVTDVQLPGLSGIELTKRIVERWIHERRKLPNRPATSAMTLCVFPDELDT